MRGTIPPIYVVYLILLPVHGKSFEELYYVDGIRYNSFYDAYIYRGLIEDRNARDWKLDIAATRDEQMSCCSQQRPTYA